MERNRKIFYVVGFLAVIILSAAMLCRTIVTTPVEYVKATAANYMLNLMNGGMIYSDEDYLYYTDPDTNTLYRLDNAAPNEKAVKIAGNCGGFLQMIGRRYYFLQGSSLVSVDYNGNDLQTVVENAKEPLVVGSAVYYLGENGNIMKYSMRYNSSTDTGITPQGSFAVYVNRIYYIADGGIYSAKTDGSDKKLFLNEAAERFYIDNKYLFYTLNGSIYSAVLSNNELKSTKITNGSRFFINVEQSNMIYSDDNAVYFGEMNKFNSDSNYSPTVLQDTPTDFIYGDGEHFYWRDADGRLCRIDADGGNKTVFR